MQTVTDKVQLMTERLQSATEQVPLVTEWFPSVTKQVPLIAERFPDGAEWFPELLPISLSTRSLPNTMTLSTLLCYSKFFSSNI